MTANTNFVIARVHRFFLPLVFVLGMSSLSGPSLAWVDCGRWPYIFFAEATVTDVERCLSAGANVNARDRDGRTPLHRAARSAGPALVQALIDAGADVNARVEGGWTPLHWTVSRGKSELPWRKPLRFDMISADHGGPARCRNSPPFPACATR